MIRRFIETFHVCPVDKPHMPCHCCLYAEVCRWSKLCHNPTDKDAWVYLISMNWWGVIQVHTHFKITFFVSWILRKSDTHISRWIMQETWQVPSPCFIRQVHNPPVCLDADATNQDSSIDLQHVTQHVDVWVPYITKTALLHMQWSAHSSTAMKGYSSSSSAWYKSLKSVTNHFAFSFTSCRIRLPPKPMKASYTIKINAVEGISLNIVNGIIHFNNIQNGEITVLLQDYRKFDRNIICKPRVYAEFPRSPAR